MVSYTKVYKVLDPIIKANPKITWRELQEKHPDVAFKISSWSFMARKRSLQGEAYGKKTKKVAKKKTKRTARGAVTVKKTAKTIKVSTDKIKKVIKKIVPSTKKFKEYLVIGKILVKKPNTIHSHLIKAGKITMCDANYYQFRRKFCTMLGLNLTAPIVDSVRGGKASSTPATPAPGGSRKRASLYTVVYEKEVNGFNDAARELLNDFIAAMNREKALGNMEMIEMVYPKKVIEVRSYK